MFIEEKNLPLVAMDFMNEIHKEDVAILNRLYDAVCVCEQKSTEENQEQIGSLYQEWLEHTVSHFAGEEKEMQAKGFPPYPIHKGEHENSLTQMRMVLETWQQQKNPEKLRLYLESYVQDWLLNHIQTLDTVTAMFLKNYA